MCVNCVVTATSFVLPMVVGGAGVLQAKIRRRTDQGPPPPPIDEGAASSAEALSLVSLHPSG